MNRLKSTAVPPMMSRLVLDWYIAQYSLNCPKIGSQSTGYEIITHNALHVFCILKKSPVVSDHVEKIMLGRDINTAMTYLHL
mmetsp:Transcript_907/g.2617  ORF Transcript_907/g.2617 Transcript_907/m.2617 type:complete len:82 (+) Transcript_907:1312-1557(+)